MKAKDFRFGEPVLLYKPNEDIYEEVKDNPLSLIHAMVTKVGRTNIEVTTVDRLVKYICKPNTHYYPDSMYTHPLSVFKGYMLFRTEQDIRDYEEYISTADWISNLFNHRFPTWLTLDQMKAIKAILEE